MKKNIFLLILLSLFSVLLSCSDPEGEEITGDGSIKSIPGTISAVRPLKWDPGVYGGIWRDTYTEDPKSYNPFSNLDGTHLIVSGLMLDYLFDYDPYDRGMERKYCRKFQN